MSHPATILVVDDEPAIRRFLRTSLKGQGFDVIEAASGAEAQEQVRSAKPELVVLDLGLPDMDGFEVIRRIRAASSLPIVVLTVRAGEREKVEALDLGADDYVTKPFGIGELLARVRTALRHRLQADGEPAVYRHDGLEVDLVRRHVRVKGSEVHLSPKEYDLLAYLVRYPGRVVTHGQILREVWGPAHAEDVEYLRVYVRQLRQKLEPDPTQPRHILTEAGVGYRLAE
jgi:two-component system KDP operon response regulator KdpE